MNGDERPLLLVALGGNALIRPGQSGTAAQQLENLRLPMRQVAKLARNYRLLITHGNGPQVGNLLLQQERCGEVPAMPLEVLVAQTQGQIGYMIESVLDSELGTSSKQRLASLITSVLVDPPDPAFDDPDKPIGPAYNEEEARSLPWPTRLTTHGYRRVVPSPKPVAIVEQEEIRFLLAHQFIVICCGGGGIPVVRRGRRFQGVDAVIDKDLASATLALEVGVETLLIATDVPGAALHYGQSGERFLRSMTESEGHRYLEQGHFPAGSMGPKVEAALQFVQGGGRRAVICAISEIEEAVAGRAGTEITPDAP
jgi:carbamate kinase